MAFWQVTLAHWTLDIAQKMSSLISSSSHWLILLNKLKKQRTSLYPQLFMHYTLSYCTLKSYCLIYVNCFELNCIFLSNRGGYLGKREAHEILHEYAFIQNIAQFYNFLCILMATQHNPVSFVCRHLSSSGTCYYCCYGWEYLSDRAIACWPLAG